jgi:hypothetical protein
MQRSSTIKAMSVNNSLKMVPIIIALFILSACVQTAEIVFGLNDLDTKESLTHNELSMLPKDVALKFLRSKTTRCCCDFKDGYIKTTPSFTGGSDKRGYISPIPIPYESFVFYYESYSNVLKVEANREGEDGQEYHASCEIYVKTKYDKSEIKKLGSALYSLGSKPKDS